MGYALWRLFTSVDFAVVQIILLVLMAIVGMTIRQIPTSRSAPRPTTRPALDDIHARYDPLLGAAVVDVLDRLWVFTIFKSPWFSVALIVLIVSIIVCTLDRTPRLWRGRERDPGRPSRSRSSTRSCPTGPR
jgi:cytochrome c biogenesis protein